MAYITLANAKRIIYNSDIMSMDLSGEVYKIPIYFFSSYEKNALLAIHELLKDPNKYFEEIYIQHETIDTYRFVYEGHKPAYHEHPTCERIQSDYQNFQIPQEIKDKGKVAVTEFRNWFETVKHLQDRPDVFVARLHAKYGIITNPKAINRENSGIVEMENYSIPELEKKIDALIKSAGRFYYENEKNTSILKRFSKCTFLAKNNEPIENNNTGYSDKEVKELLAYYDKTFKRPLKALLIEYYRLKLNPDIKMDGFFLEGLGFKACSECCGKNIDNATLEVENSMDDYYNNIEELVEMEKY